METVGPVDHHSLLRTIVLSLIPGILILLFLILFAPLANQFGLSSTLVLFAAIALVLVPFELGYLLLLGKKLNGRFSLKGIILFHEKIPLWQFFVFIPLLLLWTIFCFAVISPKIDHFFIDNFFTWLPKWFFANGFTQNAGQYSKTVLILTIILGFVFNGLVGPIVEELYFRGYLLPRLGQTGRWAPLLNVVLFSLYHLFSPWQNATRILALLPLVYVVWWKRNIVIGIVTHCSLNILGMIAMLVFLNKA
ncbi:MAG TPA: CPBP family intramembrane glutamic endopeptidase [Bacteroidota bacterium]|nr:CPBP family intramembrane glutamic endopeptidase [Bacteroidota bacterium]